MKQNDDSEFAKFDKTMDALLRVPHSEIKAKLDAEKAAKKRKTKRASSSRVKGVKPTSD